MKSSVFYYFIKSLKTMNYIKIFSLFCLFPFLILAQVKDSTAASKYDIEKCVNKFDIDKSEKTKAGYQYWFSDKNFSDGKTIKMSVVKPGLEVHPPKANAGNEFIFILDGDGEFFLDGQVKKVGSMTCLFYPANAVCGIKNIGDKDLKYLVVRAFPAI